MTAHLSLRLRRGSHWLPRRWRLRLQTRRHSSRHTSLPQPCSLRPGYAAAIAPEVSVSRDESLGQKEAWQHLLSGP